MKQLFNGLQQMGRALMLPIAVLPVAGLLLRLGQPDLLDIAFIAAAGDAIFSNLGLLFAIGVAVGLARENHGAAGLASVVGYLVTTQGAQLLIEVPPEAVAAFTGAARDLAAAAYKSKELAKLSVPAGILSGVIAGVFYNRFSDIRLPSYLAFFGGRRFVPIASGFAGLLLAAVFGYGFPWLEHGMNGLSRSVLAAGDFGLFAYGLLNRILIVTGLHHILNNIAWFLLGDFNGATGDLKRFFAGDPTAGAFMSGFFPVMMFGLPAACLAMYHAAPLDRRKAVAGLLASMALTSFLTGVTEPIEFTFMFLAPVLYAVHAVLTGVAMALMNVLDIRLGFSFSAGVFDYVLAFGRATHPLLLLPVGLVYFGLYYGLFRFFIRRFNLQTPGREAVDGAESQATVRAVDAGGQGAGYVVALGGPSNLVSVDACTTRLRLVVADQSKVNAEGLKALGARGFIRPSANALQVVVGPVADQLASEIRAALKKSDAVASAISSPVTFSADTASALLAALGGPANVRQLDAVASSRLRIAVADASRVDEQRLTTLGVRGVAMPSQNILHVVMGREADGAVASIRPLLLPA